MCTSRRVKPAHGPLLALVLAGVVLAGVVLGCDPGAEPPEPEPEGMRCIADPVAHEVQVDRCTTHADCPLGTICGSPPSSDLVEVCTPPQGLSAADALTEGFGVPSMPGTLTTVSVPTSDGSSQVGVEFGWQAPSEALVVTCVLLACPPVIEAGTIVNYDQCVLARVSSGQLEGTFNLTAPDQIHPLAEAGECEVQSPRDDTEGRFPITELLVGCWAYDEARLVAATSLERPAAHQIYDFHDNFDLDCQGEGADGRTCVLAGGTFGVCSDRHCHRICLRDADCGTERSAARPGVCERAVRFGQLSICRLGPVRDDAVAAPVHDLDLVTPQEQP